MLFMVCIYGLYLMLEDCRCVTRCEYFAGNGTRNRRLPLTLKGGFQAEIIKEGTKVGHTTDFLAFIGTGSGIDRLQVRRDNGMGLSAEWWYFKEGGKLFAIRMSTQARYEGFGERATADRYAQFVDMAGN